MAESQIKSRFRLFFCVHRQKLKYFNKSKLIPNNLDSLKRPNVRYGMISYESNFKMGVLNK